MAASLSFIVGVIGNIISLLVFTSPLSTFRKIVKNKSTDNYKGHPYITTLLSTSLWTFYGLLKPDMLVISVNGVGAVLQFIYVTLFIVYAPRNVKFKSLKLVGALNVAFMGSVIAVTLFAFHGNLRVTFVGFLCSAMTIGMYAAPMTVMRTVVKTKSVEYMPFLLSFFLFLNASIWSVYAVLVKDYFIGVPNCIGFILGSTQLILYSIYKNKSSKSEEDKESDGSANLVRGTVEMKGLKEIGYAKHENPNLHKEMSLPKPTISKQLSLKKLVKSLSFNVPDHYSNLSRDIENGDVKGSQY
ncbi:bidirectional sugar transporter SWEET16-like [Impatiens glandulifera]|uniref:bidirectional sugar transporter SWEET16-like n=1 Tax=Impatiens glandulifera TaxID=253017 RepID=UPI001FB1579C|nr:bidirectional sugar transporter SWEET16-like [Impatiens glandulifera]